MSLRSAFCAIVVVVIAASAAVADITVAPALLASTPHSRKFLADQACDARAFRRRLAEGGALVM